MNDRDKIWILRSYFLMAMNDSDKICNLTWFFFLIAMNDRDKICNLT